MKQRKPLFFILLFTFFIIAFMPYAISVAIEHSEKISNLSKMRNSRLENLSHSANICINNILNTQLEKILTIADNISCGSLETTENQDNKALLKKILSNNPNYLGVAILSSTGDLLSSTPAFTENFKELNIIKRIDKYRDQLILQQTDQGLCLPIVAPCSTQSCSILVILRVNILSDFLEELSLWPNAKIQILNHSGIILASSDNAEQGIITNNPDIINKVYAKEAGFFEYINSSSSAHMVSYISPLSFSKRETNFMVITTEPKPLTYELFTEHKFAYATPILVMLILVIISTKLLYKYINDPINDMIKMITYIHSGIFDHKIKSKRRGELGTLLKAFNHMVINLERRFQYQKRMRQEILLRNRYEEKLKSSRAEAVSVSKAKDEFLANISHEIRTPLNAIIGFSEKILLEHPDENFTSNIKTILAESDHLLLLLNDLLDNAKIEADKLDLEYIPFDLHKCLHETTDSFKEAARKKDLHFTLEISEDTPKYVIFDPLRFRQVLVNLLSNAIKFTENGSITVKTAVTKVSGDHTDIYFSVIDTGIGISKDKQKTIFDEFSQADGSTTRKYGGTGLGTTISKKLVTLMGGEMCLKSELGKGSTFWFTLSMNTGISEKDLIDISRDNASEPSDNSNKFKGTILVAEDYEVNQELIRSQLEYLGLNVLIAKNGRVALEDCKRVFFDLIFMDLQMPEMGGIEAARRIRIDYPHYEKVPIIALTANADKDIRNVCKAVGMNGILNKPTHIDELAISLAKWLPKSCTTAPINFSEEINKAQTTPFTDIITKHSTSSSSNISDNSIVTEDPINLDEAYALFGNNKMVFNMALDNFFSSFEREILPDLDLALERSDSELLRRTAHKLKGGSASLTAKKLSGIAGTLEKCSEANDFAEASDLIKEVKKAFKDVKIFFDKQNN